VTYKYVGFQIGHWIYWAFTPLTTLMITIRSGALANSHNYSLQFIVLSLLQLSLQSTITRI
jgi:hypothetical protein